MKTHTSNFTLLIAAFWTCILSQQASAQTDLADAAEEMQPGEWRTLQTQDIGNALGDRASGGVGHILPYADKLHWDPAGGKIYYTGSDDPGDGRRLVAYDVASNTWQVLPDPWGGSGVAHQYGLVDIDVRSRLIYSIMPDGGYGQVYDISNGDFSSLSMPSTAYSCCGAAAYFPDRQTLVYAWGRDLWERNQSGQWRIASGNITTSYHAVAHYNPVHELVVFGGGNDSSFSFYSMDKSGQVRSLGRPPMILQSPRIEFVAEPESGDFLVFGRGQNLYRYDPTDDNWSAQSVAGVPSIIWAGNSSNLLSTLGTALPEYGVLFFVSCESGGTCGVNIYKYGEGATAPLPPSNLTVEQ